MTITAQVLARLLNCGAFNVSTDSVDWFDEYEVPTLEQVAKAFRVAAFDEILRNRQHMILDDESAKVLRAAGLLKVGRFVASNHPEALSWDGSNEGALTAKGRAVAQRLVSYEVALREKHMTAGDLAKWRRMVHSV